MSQSRFLMILGRGNRYSGEGLQPDCLFTFFDDKGVWVVQRGKAHHRFFTNEQYYIDDAMLLINLLVLSDEILDEIPEESLLHKQDILPYIDIEGDIDKPYNSSLTIERKKEITTQQWSTLYDKNKRFISEYNIKLVCILLSSLVTHIGGVAVDTEAKQLENKLKEYGIANYEICKTILNNSFGDFDLVQQRQDLPKRIENTMLKWKRTHEQSKDLDIVNFQSFQTETYQRLLDNFFSDAGNIDQHLLQALQSLPTNGQFPSGQKRNSQTVFNRRGYMNLYRWCVTDNPRFTGANRTATALWEFLFGALPQQLAESDNEDIIVEENIWNNWYARIS